MFSIPFKRLIPTLFWASLALISFFVFFSPTDNWTWDPSYYYAQLRSPVIDNDLDFRNETITNGVNTKVTVTGLQGSVWPIGPSIFWSPFFLLAHLYMKITHPLKANGFYFPYIALVSLGSSFYGIVGLTIIYKTIRQFGDRFISRLTIFLCLCATATFFYIFRQPIMAHTSSLLASAVFTFIYISVSKGRLPIRTSGLLFGVFLSLNFLTRWSGILIGILPISFYVSRLAVAIRNNETENLKAIYLQLIIFFIAFLITTTPQLVLWYRLYGTIFSFPQSNGTFVSSPFPVNVFNVLFDLERGVLFKSPFVFISIMSLIYIPDRIIKYSFGAYVIATIILIGYRVDWYGGGGYSTRYFIEMLPVLAIGFVCLIGTTSRKKLWDILLICAALILAIHQFYLLFAFEHAHSKIPNFFQLLTNPMVIFSPLPFVAGDRQAVLVNLISGVKDLKKYLVPGTVVVSVPFMTSLLVFVSKKMDKDVLPYIAFIILVYMIGWSCFLASVG